MCDKVATGSFGLRRLAIGTFQRIGLMFLVKHNFSCLSTLIKHSLDATGQLYVDLWKIGLMLFGQIYFFDRISKSLKS